MITTQKRDLKKELKQFYNPSSKTISEVVVPPMNFLMLEGSGSPDSEAFKAAVGSLYSLAYPLKFMSKKQGADYSVMPLEGLWWSDNMDSFITREKSIWRWNVMIMQPEMITQAMVDEAIATRQKKESSPLLEQVRFETYEESRAAQILYFGSYSDEGDTIQRLHDYIEAQGCQRSGKHHEIYLSDPFRTEPAKLKTILRQPMR